MKKEQLGDICYPGFKDGLNESLIARFGSDVVDASDNVHRLLPALRRDIQYVWFNQNSGMIVPGYVTGGGLYDKPNIVSIAVDDTCTDESRIKHELRRTVFHELFHVAQQFSNLDEDGNIREFVPMIGDAIYEGAASIFERDYADDKTDQYVMPYYANYVEHEEGQLLQWCDELIAMGVVAEHDVARQWKFYHDELGVNHIMYKTGAYIVDKVLAHDAAITLVLDIATEDWSTTFNRYKAISL